MKWFRSGRARSARGWGGRLRQFVRWALAALAVYLVLIFVGIALFRFVPVPVSSLMVWRLAQGYGIAKDWVAFDQIAPALPAAVVAAEDGRFCEHNGVDWVAVAAAVEEYQDADGDVRGASTITMQTAKNLFLWPSRSYIRKALEAPLAYLIDFAWPKRRILEVYLNVVEWAPGLYGAEAAARHHFGRPAGRLTSAQAARLAAALPNPHGRNAGEPGPLTRRIAGRIARRMGAIRSRLGCLKD